MSANLHPVVRVFRPLAFLLAVLLLCATGALPARAQPGTAFSGPAAAAKPAGGDPVLGKVSSHLLAARRLLQQGEALAEVKSRLSVVTWQAERVQVEVRLDLLSPALLAQLEAAGLEITYSSERYARAVGHVAPEDLEAIARLPEVATIHPLYGYARWAGSVDNQADVSINADDARSTFGIDGSGVEIGVLSDSFNDIIGGSISGSGCNRVLTGSSSQSSGDLPASVRLLDNGPGGGIDEGAGMAELIHDLVPGASLSFHTAFSSEAAFADGIDDLVACDADVLVDDIIFFAEPMFQDGPVAQAAQDAFDAGIPYYSSAGNSGTFGADEMYDDFGATDGVFGEDFHDFGSGDRFASITIPGGGCNVLVVLQWNDPFDGTLGPGASDDFDLLGCTSASVASCTFGSVDSQGCTFGGGVQAGDPLEILGLTNNGAGAATVFFAVNHFCGDEDAHFRLATFTNCSSTGYTFESGIFDQPQIYGHPAAQGADAVAAVFYGEIDTNGGFQSPFGGQIDVEPFSSLGGDLPFYFDAAGNPLAGAPVTRFKPQIAAPDGTNTTFFGSDSGFDVDSDPNFFGTSAAAPHAAAVAALVKEASPSLEPNGVRQVLAASARDIEAGGVDDLSGDGLVDAFDAVQTVSSSGSDCIDDLELNQQDVQGTQFFRACESIRAGDDYRVTDNGDLTFRTGDRILLFDGFSVAANGSFTAEFDPSL